MRILCHARDHPDEELLGAAVSFLVSNSKIKVQFYEGKPLGIELPPTIDLRVIETEPGMPSATATNVLKPAKVETGLVVPVPHFIQEGEVIRVVGTLMDITQHKEAERQLLEANRLLQALATTDGPTSNRPGRLTCCASPWASPRE